MKTYQELQVWQRGVDFVVALYKTTASFPKPELFGLSSQIRRAAVTIPANIAEGYCRQHRKEYVQFVRIAFASGGELETHLVIAYKLGFLGKEDYDILIASLDVIMRMLNKLLSSLVARP